MLFIKDKTVPKVELIIDLNIKGDCFIGHNTNILVNKQIFPLVGVFDSSRLQEVILVYIHS